MKIYMRKKFLIDKNVIYEPEEFFRDVWADITYKDGRKERLKIIDVLNFYTNGKTPPKITDVSFIGDVSRQGVLPDLVKYFIETSQ